MATHSGVIAGKILRKEELSRLQSMGSQRVRHDLVTEHECMYSNHSKKELTKM